MRFGRVASLLVGVVLTTVLLLSGCAAEPTTTPPEYAGPKAISTVQAGMRLEIQTDQATYFAGHPIKIRVSLVNTTNKEITFTTPTALVFDILYEATGEPSVKRWSDGRSFAQVVTSHKVPVEGGLSQTLELAIVSQGEARLWARLDTGTLVLDTDKVTITIQ